MKIILKIYSNILGVKITVFSQKWSIQGVNLIKDVKISDFDPKIVKNIVKNICILTAVKNYDRTSSLWHSLFECDFVAEKTLQKYVGPSVVKEEVDPFPEFRAEVQYFERVIHEAMVYQIEGLFEIDTEYKAFKFLFVCIVHGVEEVNKD